MLKQLVTKRTLNNSRSKKQIEKDFDAARASYMKELNKLRSKYEAKFVSLSEEYGMCCALSR